MDKMILRRMRVTEMSGYWVRSENSNKFFDSLILKRIYETKPKFIFFTSLETNEVRRDKHFFP